MPVYRYTCQLCGKAEDHCVPYNDRLEPQVCPHEGCDGKAAYQGVQGGGPHVAGYPVSRRKDDGRIIQDERQVTSELGEDWRDEGTTRREGGAGKRIYLT